MSGFDWLYPFGDGREEEREAARSRLAETIAAAKGEEEPMVKCGLCNGRGSYIGYGLGVDPAKAPRETCVACDGKGKVPLSSSWRAAGEKERLQQCR